MHRTSSLLPSLRFAGALRLFAWVAVAAGPVGAADYHWDANGKQTGTGGSGDWNTNSASWRLESATGRLERWRKGPDAADRAVFGGTSGTVSVGKAISTNGLLFTTSGYTLTGGTITLTGIDPSITVAGSGADSATIGAALAGTNVNLVKAGDGVLTLTAVNRFTGTLTVNAGTLRLGGGTDRDFINRDAKVVLNAGTIDLGNFIEDTDVFTLNGGTITGGASAALGVLTDRAGAASGFSVRSGTADVILSDPFAPNWWAGDATSVGLTKTTDGLVTLTRANTYTGATRILGGTLVLNGAIRRDSAVTVARGATFAGIGTTNNAPITLDGTISPGAVSATGVSDIGILTTGAQTWNAGGSYVWQIADAAGAAGTGWDLLRLGGPLTVAATAADPFKLQLIGLGADGGTGVIAGFDNTRSYVWSLLTTSAIAGLTADSVSIDSTWFAAGNPLAGGTFSLARNGTSLDLVFTPVPEPATYALALGIGTFLLVAVRRRAPPGSAG